MTSEETRVLKLVDEYSRDQHRCFVAEMFLKEATTGYTLCFRPIAAERDSPNRYVCRYLYLERGEVKTLAEQGKLTPSITERLDKGLRSLGESL
jgi:hypothetical protein